MSNIKGHPVIAPTFLLFSLISLSWLAIAAMGQTPVLVKHNDQLEAPSLSEHNETKSSTHALADSVEAFCQKAWDAQKGYWPVYDLDAEQQVALQGIRIQKDEIMRIGDHLYAIPLVAFTPGGQLYTLDVFVESTQPRTKVIEVSVRQVGDDQRYQWKQQDGRWWRYWPV